MQNVLTSQSILENVRYTMLGQHIGPSALMTCIQQWQIPDISQDGESLCSASSHFCSVEDGEKKLLPDHHYMQNYMHICIVAHFTVLHHQRIGPAMQKHSFSCLWGFFVCLFLFVCLFSFSVSFEKLASYVLACVI